MLNESLWGIFDRAAFTVHHAHHPRSALTWWSPSYASEIISRTIRNATHSSKFNSHSFIKRVHPWKYIFSRFRCSFLFSEVKTRHIAFDPECYSFCMHLYEVRVHCSYVMHDSTSILIMCLCEECKSCSSVLPVSMYIQQWSLWFEYNEGHCFDQKHFCRTHFFV